MKHAIVAIEDKRFYEHRGVDVHGILRALWADVTHGGAVQGGSTITQQFVKNAINGNAPTLDAQAREAALAWQLEQEWSKDKILTAYLNTIYFGNGAYGVEEASPDLLRPQRRRTVNPAEAALLAGIPEDPTLYDPVAHPQQARARRNLVLYADVPAGLPRRRRSTGTACTRRCRTRESVRLPADQSHAAPLLRELRHGAAAVQRYEPQKVYGGGLRVTTTIDLGLQKLAQQAIAKELPPSIGPTAALVAIDARTGAVLAMVGGRNYHAEPVQPRDAGRAPAGLVVQAVRARRRAAAKASRRRRPSHLAPGDDRRRRPALAREQLRGRGPRARSTSRRRSPQSDNTVFAQLTNVVGPANVVAAAKELGITHAAPAVLLDRPRRRAGDPARDGSRLRDASRTAATGIDSSLFGNKPSAIECCRAVAGQDLPAEQRGRRSQVARRASSAAIVDQLLARRRSATARAPQRRSRAARSPARPARPRTTATPGSSASRRSS